VRWYCRYGLSYRDLEGMLTERGVAVDHTTIYRWVQKYGPELDKRTRWYRQTSPWFSDSWRVDETYIRVGGKWCYLYRAVTKDGRTLDFYISTRRNTQAATRFWEKRCAVLVTAAGTVAPQWPSGDLRGQSLDLRASGRGTA
jgi:IS6 family transposase